MGWWVTNMGAAEISRKLRERVLPNLRYLPRSRIRRCGACRELTIILAFGEDEEFHLCLHCRANLRYEMLASHIRECYPQLEQLDVLELDFNSPLRPILLHARSYMPSFYRDNVLPGTYSENGVICQDITRLTLPDESLDLVVSSDVLEHVPDFTAALRESWRVLRSGGAHLFTVPPRAVTRRRAQIEGGRVVHLLEPEYHLDPLSREGVLAFWDFGPDMADHFHQDGMSLRQVRGPAGSSSRTVWEARKLS